jgi:hypothetical protein
VLGAQAPSLVIARWSSQRLADPSLLNRDLFIEKDQTLDIVAPIDLITGLR